MKRSSMKKREIENLIATFNGRVFREFPVKRFSSLVRVLRGRGIEGTGAVSRKASQLRFLYKLTDIAGYAFWVH